MAQRPKAHVREAITAAAARELAERGYAGMTLAAVAERAGTSVGNLYKYFTGKEALFEATIPPALVGEVRRLFRARVQALGELRDVARVPAAHPYRDAARALLALGVDRRHELLFLLRRADGTPYAGFADELVLLLTRLAVAYARRAYPGAAFPAHRRRAVTRIYRGFVAALASILAEEDGARALEHATELLTTYHLAGLRALFAAAAAAPEEAA